MAPPAASKPGSPQEIAAQLAPLIKADPITVSVVLAGYFRAIRENSPAGLHGLKAGIDPLRIELEKIRRWYLETARTGDGADDPTAALLAAGAALATGGE
jgi:hypothetical protein